jgi:hypothetical protein
MLVSSPPETCPKMRRIRRFHPPLPVDPVNGHPSDHIHQRLVVRQVGGPFSEPGIREVRRLRMWVVDRAQERVATASGQLVLDGLGDEAAPISLEPVNPLDQLGGQGDCDAFSRAHDPSMTESMIILKTLIACSRGRRNQRRCPRSRCGGYVLLARWFDIQSNCRYNLYKCTSRSAQRRTRSTSPNTVCRWR